QVFMHLPLWTGTLLVQVHTHDQWFAQLFAFCNKLLPARMVTQNIAYEQLFVGFLGGCNHGLCICYRFSKRLFNKYMGSCLQCLDSILGMGTLISIDRNGIRFRFVQRFFIIVESGEAAQLFGKFISAFRSAADQPDNAGTIQSMVCLCVRAPHISTAYNKYFN